MRQPVKDFKTSRFFDGVDDYIVSANNLGISGAQACSMNIWGYIQKIDSSFNVLCAIGVPSGSPTGYIITIDSSNNIVARLSGTTSTPAVNALSYKNKWAMFTLTSSGTVMKLYMDGVLVGVVNVSPNLTNGKFVVGADTVGGSPEYFGGYLDEAAAWNVELTTDEVLNLYKGIMPSTNPVVYWKFDDDSSTIADSSGNNNTGTVTGATRSNNVPMRSRLEAGYVPLGIPNLKAWIRADRNVHSSVTGGVCIISDLTNQNKDFIQNTAASQPIYINSGINSLPSLQFDGSNDGMSTVNPLAAFLPGTNNEYTYYVVARASAITNNPADASAWLGDGLFVDNSGFVGSLLRTASGGQIYAYHYDTGAKLISHPITTNETYLHSARFGSGTLASRKNNGTESTLSVGLVGGDAAAFNFGYGYTQNYKFTGQMSEWIFFDRRLSDEEDTLVRAYLSNRYSIA